MLRVLTPLRIGALLGIIVALLRLSGPAAIESVAARALDNRLAARSAQVPGPEVVIVAVDDASLDALGRWPWSRATMARLVDRISAADAAVIGFDLVQSEASEDDAALTESVARSQRLVLGYYFDFGKNQSNPNSLANRFSSYAAVWNGPEDASQAPVPEATSLRPNLPALNAVAREIGYFNFIPDPDGSYRRIPLVVRVGDRFALPLSLAMLHVYRPEWTMGVRFQGSVVDTVQVGPVTIPVAEDGQILINYRGPGHSFRHVAASDVLAGKIGAETLAGKIVLVGVTATAVADVRVTPLDGLMPGVEIHANVIDSVLRNDFLWSSSKQIALIESVVLFALSIVLGACLTYVRGLWSFLLALGFGGAFHFLSQRLFVDTGISLSLMFPLLAIALTYGGVSLQHFLLEEREKRRTRNALELYLTPAVARLVSNNPELLTLGGDTRELTVMFLDIRGFTTISERMSDQPQELVALLNQFLDAMSHVIFDHDGTLDKYVGDEIMAFWGAPLPQPDHAQRACTTALALMDRLHRLNEEFTKRGWPALDIGIGIHSGAMVVGNIGSSRRFCYTVVGDNVNLAARLEGLNRKYGTHIIASAATIGAADVIAREVDVVRVRGKDQAVHVFEIVATKNDWEAWEPVIKPFHVGLGQYRSQRWAEARESFRSVQAAKSDDAPAKLYLERIEWFEQNPPPADWDGVTVMETK